MESKSASKKENDMYLENNQELASLMEVFSREIMKNKPSNIVCFTILKTSSPNS